jgi:DNA-binding MarR family transcriptional regulator
MPNADGGISALMDDLAVIPGREQEREVLAALGRIIRSAGSGIREAGRAAGLGASHLLVLQLLELEGPRRAGEIAKDLAFSKSTITAILDTLEERKFIIRDRHESDGRSVLVSLTDAGKRTLALVPAAFQSQFLARFNKLPDWERALVLSALLRVSDMLAVAPAVV